MEYCKDVNWLVDGHMVAGIMECNCTYDRYRLLIEALVELSKAARRRAAYDWRQMIEPSSKRQVMRFDIPQRLQVQVRPSPYYASVVETDVCRGQVLVCV